MGWLNRLLGRRPLSPPPPERRRRLEKLFTLSAETSRKGNIRHFEVLDAGPVTMAVVDLLFEECPQVHFDSLTTRLQERNMVAAFAQHEGVGAVLPRDTRVFHQGQELPPMVLVELAPFVITAEPDDSEEEADTSESVSIDISVRARDESAEWAASQCRFGVRIFDRAVGLPPLLRLRKLAEVVRAATELLSPKALLWRSAQRVVSVQSFLDATEPFDVERLLPLVTAIRHIRVANGTREERLIDSLGLADFGIPDVQMHFRELSPTEALSAVYAVAETLWRRGPPGEELQTLGGIEGLPNCLVNHAPALREPERVVLDLDPGDPYAAGRRPRAHWSGALN